LHVVDYSFNCVTSNFVERINFLPLHPSQYANGYEPSTEPPVNFIGGPIKALEVVARGVLH
jgi:hypothetical protein